ncbi:MAG: tetratricopeptide repeat protein [Fimbriimonadaceae bacterium]
MAVLAGCQVKPPRNPNDPNQVGAAKQPQVIHDYIEQMSRDVIGPAVAANQITQPQGDQLMIQGAKDYLKTVHIKHTPPNVVWMLGKAYFDAHEWDRAAQLLEEALTADTSADRLVHDRVWLARCQAELGQVDDAIKTARSAFAAPPAWKWPILYAVYLEIVPAAERIKSADRIQLAHLVEDAIKQHAAATGTLEDPRTRSYVVTRNYHIAKAWSLVVQLYNAANRPDLARAAAAKATAQSQHAGKTSIPA